MNKSKARRERKFKEQTDRKIQVAYAKTARQFRRPVVIHPGVKADLVGQGDGSWTY